MAHQAPRQLALVMVSQALSSGGNFTTALLAARAGSSAEFGQVALVLAFYATAAALVRPMAGTVIQTTVLAAGPSDEQRQAAGTIPVALFLSLGLTAGFLPVGVLLFDGEPKVALLLSIALVPALVVHDTLRLWSISIRRPVLAVSLDAAWLSALAIGLVVLYSRDEPVSSTDVLVVWAVTGAFVAAAAWLAAVVVVGHLGNVSRAIAEAKRLGTRYLGDASLAALSNTGYLLFLPLVVTIGEIGRVRALEIPFGLLTAAALGLTLFVQPATRRRVVSGDVDGAWRVARLAGFAVVTGALGLAIVSVAVPTEDLRQVVGTAYVRDIPLLLGVTVKYVSFAALLVCTVMSRSLNRHAEMLKHRVGHTATGLLLGAALAPWSLALAYTALYAAIGLGCFWIIGQLRRAAKPPRLDPAEPMPT